KEQALHRVAAAARAHQFVRHRKDDRNTWLHRQRTAPDVVLDGCVLVGGDDPVVDRIAANGCLRSLDMAGGAACAADAEPSQLPVEMSRRKSLVAGLARADDVEHRAVPVAPGVELLAPGQPRCRELCRYHRTLLQREDTVVQPVMELRPAPGF